MICRDDSHVIDFLIYDSSQCIYFGTAHNGMIHIVHDSRYFVYLHRTQYGFLFGFYGN